MLEGVESLSKSDIESILLKRIQELESEITSLKKHISEREQRFVEVQEDLLKEIGTSDKTIHKAKDIITDLIKTSISVEDTSESLVKAHHFLQHESCQHTFCDECQEDCRLKDIGLILNDTAEKAAKVLLEEGKEWHDLEKNPNDLPEGYDKERAPCSYLVYVEYLHEKGESGYVDNDGNPLPTYYYKVTWCRSKYYFDTDKGEKVIAWREIPHFIKMEA